MPQQKLINIYQTLIFDFFISDIYGNKNGYLYYDAETGEILPE